MLDFLKKGFRQAPKPNKKIKAKQEAIKAFGIAYEKVCREFSLQLVPIIKQLPHGGFEPDFQVIQYLPPADVQLKGWGEAAEENLKVAENCRHLNENGENCKHCAVRVADQDPSGTGITATYKEAKLARIAEWKKKGDEQGEVRQEKPAAEIA